MSACAFAVGKLGTPRCAVLLNENPGHFDACSSTPTYPTTSSTKCTQVSIATVPIPSTCPGLNCTFQNASAGCWVQASTADISGSRLDGWIQSGPDCDDPYAYLPSCPYSKCRTGERVGHWAPQPPSRWCGVLFYTPSQCLPQHLIHVRASGWSQASCPSTPFVLRCCCPVTCSTQL